jgi:hypothetical protein
MQNAAPERLPALHLLRPSGGDRVRRNDTSPEKAH